jgi:hypothetical protein
LRRVLHVVARCLLGIAFMLGVAALVAAGLGIYLALLPVRLAARKDPSRERSRALQELLLALVAVAAIRRG